MPGLFGALTFVGLFFLVPGVSVDGCPGLATPDAVCAFLFANLFDIPLYLQGLGQMSCI